MMSRRSGRNHELAFALNKLLHPDPSGPAILLGTSPTSLQLVLFRGCTKREKAGRVARQAPIRLPDVGLRGRKYASATLFNFSNPGLWPYSAKIRRLWRRDVETLEFEWEDSGLHSGVGPAGKLR